MLNSRRARYVICGSIAASASELRLYLVNVEEKLLTGQLAPGELLHDRRYHNQKYATFAQIVQTFLNEYTLKIGQRSRLHVSAACFSVAGPVDSNLVTFTNRSNWVIDIRSLQSQLDIGRIELINDFVSLGYGLLTLADGDCVTIQEAPAISGAPIACIGAGTGLGECYLAANHNIYSVWPSEGGHCEFAPRNDLEIELLQFLKSKYNEDFRVSVERIVSRRGVVNVFEFLSHHEKFKAKVTPEIRDSFDTALKKAAVILENYHSDEICQRSMDIVIGTYGSEAGCAALKWLPYGGLYITGKFARQHVEFIKSDVFISAYQDKGRVSPIIRQVPIKVVMVDDLDQRGTHYLAVKCLHQLERELRRAKFVALPKTEVYVSLGLLAVAVLLGGLYRCVCS